MSGRGSGPSTPRTPKSPRAGLLGDDSQHVKINVCVRVRPLNQLEKRTKQVDAWSYSNNEIYQTVIPWDKESKSPSKATTRRMSVSGSKESAVNFRFDKIFLPAEKNDCVHEFVGTKVVDFVMKGYHGCLFAYGQTSAGKTYTIHGSESDPGVLPRSIELIFKHIEDQPDREFVLRVSFFEIYNEVVIDLLSLENVNLRIREDRKRGVFVQGLKEEVVITPEQVINLLKSGLKNRHVGRTNYNEASSRSHTVFRLVVESAQKRAGSRSRRSCLNIVDLAGSENAVKAGKGSRIKETGYINKSLLTLGHVMKKLSEKNKGHIPYRNSKLTRILQNSLSGQAAVAVVCCISPSSNNLEETISTLKFAARAKRIKASVKVNYDEATLLSQYRNEIERLKKEVRVLRARAKASETGEDGKLDELSKTVPLSRFGSDRVQRMESSDMPHQQIQERKARINQLTRIILKSSKATMPKDMDKVITEKLQSGQISLDEFTQIKSVIQKAQTSERSVSGTRRPDAKHSAGLRAPTTLKASPRANSKQKTVVEEDTNVMLAELKRISTEQAEEIARLKEENESLKIMNQEKDEALQEWDMFYQNLQNKPQQDTDNLAAQMLAMEAQVEEERLEHAAEVDRLRSELRRVRVRGHIRSPGSSSGQGR
uniref:Kinesin motor domain-containing protein n=1 Tax=Lotharella globosa TaxID=91324 RepID=A0A7S3Y799_9EUKA|mmetsp:Transcript_4919/g.9657  ORF Transcript_4919/g.9657 Transcript_4919/m.9657 type:complete len:655 (+) Transcript_4919:107-2071(+)